MTAMKARRAVAGAGVALTLAFGLSACGGNGTSIDRTALTQKVKSLDQLKGAPSEVVDCVVNTALKYGDKDLINQYIHGKGSLHDVVKSKADKEKANRAVEECAKK